MFLHHVHQFLVFGQDLGARHAARKDQGVARVQFFGFGAEDAESRVCDDLHVVGTGDVELVGNGDQFGGNSAAAEDIQGGEGLGLFEAVSEENVCVVHGKGNFALWKIISKFAVRIEVWCNGSTRDFGSLSQRSNRCTSTEKPRFFGVFLLGTSTFSTPTGFAGAPFQGAFGLRPVASLFVNQRIRKLCFRNHISDDWRC